MFFGCGPLPVRVTTRITVYPIHQELLGIAADRFVVAAAQGFFGHGLWGEKGDDVMDTSTLIDPFLLKFHVNFEGYRYNVQSPKMTEIVARLETFFKYYINLYNRIK